MESIRDIYRIGQGPSSSHTMGPKKAAAQFSLKNPDASSFRVTLYGSLAATGHGHLTDKAIFSVMGTGKTDLIWRPEIFLPRHPNGMLFEALDTEGKVTDDWTVFSIGGGKITDFITEDPASRVYELTTMDDILQWTENTGRSFWEYVEITEGPEIYDYLAQVWKVMTAAIRRGIEEDGILPGGLHVRRKAAEMGIEHHLGLTCDPVAGLVQIPCIERNAFAAERALNTATFALLSDGRHLITFDKIVKTMNQTGHDLPSIYRETSEGGMAILGM